LFDLSLADESIANPPLDRVDEVYISDCLGKLDYDFWYKPPAALTIHNKDNSPITLR
jgi:hypothetical protein